MKGLEYGNGGGVMWQVPSELTGSTGAGTGRTILKSMRGD